jgi:hypothetical protein
MGKYHGVKGSEFEVEILGLRVKVYSLGFRAWNLRFIVQGIWFRV